MKRKTSLLIGIGLLAISICFTGYAAYHPETGFPWSPRVTFMLYGIYVWMLFRFLLGIPVLSKTGAQASDSSLIITVLFFFVSAAFFIMEITGPEADCYTIVRGTIIAGGIDVGIENLILWIKQKKKKQDNIIPGK